METDWEDGYSGQRADQAPADGGDQDEGLGRWLWWRLGLMVGLSLAAGALVVALIASWL